MATKDLSSTALCKPRPPSHYQPLVSATMEKDRPYHSLKVIESRDGKKRGGLRPTKVNLALDEQLYDIPTK